MPRVALRGLLGAAALLAAVSSVPVDSGSHDEEMVTRCIIEVLSNALSKSSIPPVTPECQQVLENSEKEAKKAEKNENEDTKFEVRLLRDPVDASGPYWTSSRREAGAPGEDTESQTKPGTEKWAEEGRVGGGHGRGGDGEAQEGFYPSDSHVPKETKTSHSEKREGEKRTAEEGENYPKVEHRGDVGEGKQLEPGEKQKPLLSERNQAVARKQEEVVARAPSQSAGRSGERTHSREQSSLESGGEPSSQELSSQAPSQEDSVESREDSVSEVAKQPMRPRHHHGRSRPDKSSWEGSPPSEGGGQALEEEEEDEKREHHATHPRASEEEPDFREVGRSHPVFQAPQNLDGEQDGGRGSEEGRAPRPQSEENLEDKVNQPSSELENVVKRYSEESEEGEVGEGDRGEAGGMDALSPLGAREEQRLLGEAYHHVPESQLGKAKRHPQSKWRMQERNYLNYGDEGVPGKWQLGDPQENREEVSFQDKQYAPYLTSEKKKRLGVLFNPYFDPLQWKNSNFERKTNMDDNFLEGEEENGLTLNEKNFFPEYNYDVWEKKPFSEDVNWGFEKRSFPRVPKLDLKRQYDRVAELDQLLHFRKKSAEFPDFYDAEGPTGPRQEAVQRALTEEEEKELESLAAVDLELQKLAETFSKSG